MLLPKRETDMRFVNLTPHTINVLYGDGEKAIDVPPSGDLARVSQIDTPCDPIGDIPVCITSYGEVTGLPDPEEGVIYIVSGQVASAAPRADVMSPGSLVRNKAGDPVGCKGLRRSV